MLVNDDGPIRLSKLTLELDLKKDGPHTSRNPKSTDQKTHHFVPVASSYGVREMTSVKTHPILLWKDTSERSNPI